MSFWSRNKSPSDDDLIRARPHPPRFDGGGDGTNCLRIGFLIDWLDSRPECIREDNAKLGYVRSCWDQVAHAAGVLGERPITPIDEVLSIRGRYWHNWEYPTQGADYHADIVGHCADDELPLARAVYERLRRVDQGCLSALANLAELERRAGRLAGARDLLDEAIERATASAACRHRVSDKSWLLPLQCARARLEQDPGDATAYLSLATYDHVTTLADTMRRSWYEDELRVQLHRAIGAATFEQRMYLQIAMQMAHVLPLPPPSVHESFDVIAEIDRLADAAQHWHLIKPGS